MKKKNGDVIGIAVIALILTVGAGLGFYFAKSGAYRETFMPNTTINGIAVAGMGIDEVKAVVEAELADYELKISERTGAGECIRREEIGLRTEFDGGLEQILDLQEPMMWIKSLWTETDYRIGTMLVYDEELLEARIRELSFMDPENMQEPEDAYLSDYQFDTNSYEVIAPVEGTVLVAERVQRVITDAVLNLQTEVDLDAAGCYLRPAVEADDPNLTALAAELNRYVGTSVTYRFGEFEEVLDGDTIHQWLTIDGITVTLDESKVPEYVKSIARKYNTAYEKRPFLTTYGDVVTLPGGSFGWRMNQTAETEAVLDAIRAGAVRTREPEWLQKGASFGEYDYGDTYVEVNLTGQKLFFYKEGKLLVECDFVSGNASKGWSTPAGIYPLTYKERNATLRGENYATPVSYWMPFNGNVGLHDADWRASFGGAIYKTNGSHGCVNLPPKAAKIIYENIAKGDPVICYHLEGTENKATSKADKINISGVASVVEQENVPAVPESKPAESTPAVPESKPAESAPVVPENKPAESAPAVPESKPVESAPAVPESKPAESTPTTPESGVVEIAPVTPDSEQAPGAGSVVIVPEGAQTPETAPAVPEGAKPQETEPAIPGGALIETRPAGYGPGYPGEPAIGPGSNGSGSSGPGSSAGPNGPGSDGNVTVPSGPGFAAGPSQTPAGPGA